MAYDTFTLNVREKGFGGALPTRVGVKVYPIADNTGRLLKKILDTAGNTVLSGHVEDSLTDHDAGVPLLAVEGLPDPRDLTLNPAGFGFEVRVTTNYFSHTERFGVAEITEKISGGVLELEDVSTADASTFTSSVVSVDLDSPNFTGTPTVDGVPLTPFAIVNNPDGTVTITTGNTIIDGGNPFTVFTQFQVLDGGRP